MITVSMFSFQNMFTILNQNNMFSLIIHLNVKALDKLYFNILGAYVPITRQGNIVVDGILASCYASVDHDLSHIAIAPIQWYSEIIEFLFGKYEGSPEVVDIAKHLGRMVLPYGSVFGKY